MSYAVMIAVQAATAAKKERARIIDAFRLQQATSPERARPLDELGIPMSDRSLATYIRAGVIRGVDTRGRLAVTAMRTRASVRTISMRAHTSSIAIVARSDRRLRRG